MQSISASIKGSVPQNVERWQACLRFFEIALVLVRLNHVPSRIVNVDPTATLYFSAAGMASESPLLPSIALCALFTFWPKSKELARVAVQALPAFTVIDFLSDPNSFVDLTPTATVVETGNLQLVGTYINDRGETVSLNVQSDREVPDTGSTVSLLGLGLLGIGAIRRKLAV